jgi:hypothetical protein
LFDFLYRDLHRLHSYYSQFFQGRLLSRERSEGVKKSKDMGGKFSTGIFGGDRKTTDEGSQGTKEVFDPLDMLTTETLSVLSQFYSTKEPLLAKAGQAVSVEGTLALFDRRLSDLAKNFILTQIHEEEKKPKNKRDQEMIQNNRSTIGAFENLVIPSAYLLRMDDGVFLGGVIRDEHLLETIPSYYYRFGGMGLRVRMIGIREQAVNFDSDVSGLFSAAAMASSNVIGSMLFAPDTVQVTPIAIFREIPITPPSGD